MMLRVFWFIPLSGNCNKFALQESLSVVAYAPFLILTKFNMPGIVDAYGRPYMTEEEMAAVEAESSLSSVIPWGGKYLPGVGVVAREGFDIVTPRGERKGDLHQRILSYSVAGHGEEVDNAIETTRIRFPRAVLVDTTEYFEPATLLMRDLHEALRQYGDYLIHLAATGTGANEQAIRLAMGSLGGPDSVKILALVNNYPGASLLMNAICNAVGWKGSTSLESPAELLELDGSNMDEVFARCLAQGKKPILIMEDGIQGVGGFTLLDERFLRALAERVHDAGGRKIYDNVQALVRATGGKGLFGFNRWVDPDNPKHLPDFVTLAKGLGDGHGIAALAVLRSLAEEVKRAPNGPGNTFDTFNRLRDALAAARKVLEVSQRDRLYENVHARGEQFQGNLGPMVERFPGVVKGVVGIGGMTGLEFQDADKLGRGMVAAPSAGIVVAKGVGKGKQVMRLPLQFDTPPEFVDRVSGCVKDMLTKVQAETGA